ncbi:ABC transporter ATP-binding protein [Adlercreutzia caecimuris]|uniref:ABC transporter ATP-binding protein n=1 Tax=Adlercreutzia caecimuris TaxID=671266 RepID=UPI00272A84AF|nr:ABC transporter ATP-binding protein [Adlercreutzia caecimuris]
MALLALDRVTFAYPGAAAPALDGVSLAFPAGSYTLIAGLSGCGKTTLLRTLKTPLAPAGRWEGVVRCDGVPLAEISLRDQARRIGFVMQEPDAQIVCDSVEAELAFGLENVGAPREVIGLKVAEVASFFGIHPWLHRRTASLSGGQKQLLNLAAVLALGPEVLVLDEPTSQLDPLAADEFLAAVRRVNRELGVTVVMAEHRLEGTLADADQLAVLEDGRVAAAGEPRAVAGRLCAVKSPMAAALPAAVRVWFAVEGTGSRVGEGPSAEDGCGSTDGRRVGEGGCDAAAPAPAGTVSADTSARAPLTVREGRAWLAARERRRAADGAPEGIPSFPPGETGAIGAPGGACAPAPGAENGPKANDLAALRLRDVWFRYEREAPDVLRGFSLDVRAGSVTALIGANGAGKSTVLRAACGLARPYRGSVEVLGQRLRRRGAAPAAGPVALLPQDPTLLFSRETVCEELADGGPDARDAEALSSDARSVETSSATASAMAEAVALCALEPLMGAHPLDLSGGERQRVALAKVLLARPRLLLLDEPGKGIDAAFKAELGALLRQVAAEGATVLIATHDLDFCARWADEAALVFDGAVAAAASPCTLLSRADFYTTAASRMARDFIPDAVTVDDIVEACRREGEWLHA